MYKPWVSRANAEAYQLAIKAGAVPPPPNWSQLQEDAHMAFFSKIVEVLLPSVREDMGDIEYMEWTLASHSFLPERNAEDDSVVYSHENVPWQYGIVSGLDLPTMAKLKDLYYSPPATTGE